MENLLVAHDDLDIPFGTIRIRAAGGPGGQRGMASTIEQLGTKEFPRLRLGIGRPPGRMDPKDYVLQDFSKEDQKFLPEVLDRAADAALEFVMKGLNAAMNKYNGSIEIRKSVNRISSQKNYIDLDSISATADSNSSRENNPWLGVAARRTPAYSCVTAH